MLRNQTNTIYHEYSPLAEGCVECKLYKQHPDWKACYAAIAPEECAGIAINLDRVFCVYFIS